jgi:replicative DNA helicase
MALLGAMIYDNEVIGDVIEIVNAREMFAFQSHQVVFEAILRLHLERKPIDLVVLRDDLAKDRRLEQVGGAEYLVGLVEGVPNAANAAEYARTIHEKFILRNIIETCQKIVHQATHVTEDVDTIRNEAEKALFAALAKGEKATVRTMVDILHDTFQQIQDIHDRKARLLGLSDTERQDAIQDIGIAKPVVLRRLGELLVGADVGIGIGLEEIRDHLRGQPEVDAGVAV